MSKNIKQFPNSEPKESPFTLDEIRSRLSGLFNSNIRVQEMGVLELILCLANEIQELKDKNDLTK